MGGKNILLLQLYDISIVVARYTYTHDNFIASSPVLPPTFSLFCNGKKCLVVPYPRRTRLKILGPQNYMSTKFVYIYTAHPLMHACSTYQYILFGYHL